MAYLANPIALWLLSHAYGQGGAVAVPNSDSSAFRGPMGQFPPGIDDMIERLVSVAQATSPAVPSLPEWCFLVGGPGNGKSESLKRLAERLGIPLPPKVAGAPVPRTVPTTWPRTGWTTANGLEVAFVNDASVPRADVHGFEGNGSLFMDIRDGMSKVLRGSNRIMLVANVNRGVLLEEVARIGTDAGGTGDSDRCAEAVLRWLLNPLSGAATAVSQLSMQITSPVNRHSPYYGQVLLQAAGGLPLVRIHAVFLDVLSMLEPPPGRRESH